MICFLSCGCRHGCILCYSSLDCSVKGLPHQVGWHPWKQSIKAAVVRYMLFSLLCLKVYVHAFIPICRCTHARTHTHTHTHARTHAHTHTHTHTHFFPSTSTAGNLIAGFPFSMSIAAFGWGLSYKCVSLLPIGAVTLIGLSTIFKPPILINK